MSETENDKWRREHGFKTESLKITGEPAAPDDGLALLTDDGLKQWLSDRGVCDTDIGGLLGAFKDFEDYVARKQLAADTSLMDMEKAQSDALIDALDDKVKSEVAAAVKAERDWIQGLLLDFNTMTLNEFVSAWIPVIPDGEYNPLAVALEARLREEA